MFDPLASSHSNDPDSQGSLPPPDSNVLNDAVETGAGGEVKAGDLKDLDLPSDHRDLGSTVEPQSHTASREDLPLGVMEQAMTAMGRDRSEAQSIGKVDSADAEVDRLFAAGRRTEDSPVNQLLWGRSLDLAELFNFEGPRKTCDDDRIRRHVNVVRGHRDRGTLYDDQGKLSADLLTDLAQEGYWGELISPTYGGMGNSMSGLVQMITAIAAHEATVAGLASIHGCIGAVDPVETFGTEEQKRAILPKLAIGERLSAFALTEPNAGSDLTAIKTTAIDRGDFYSISGEKLFISNAGLGRTVGLVALLDGKPNVFVVDLPDTESESFQIKKYEIGALRRIQNVGLVFNDFLVPKENVLRVKNSNGEMVLGKGLTIAYHGLNRGRVSLCANAAGVMRFLMKDMLPWAHKRVTFGKSIAERELVQRRVGKMAGYIVEADALAKWCGNLLDKGYRAEAECIIAKIAGSELQKNAAIELYMKTHGGRSFLGGHPFAENILDYLAPCIYEGEGEILSQAYLKALTKELFDTYLAPLNSRIADLKKSGKIKEGEHFNKYDPFHVWKVRKELLPLLTWVTKKQIGLAVGKGLELVGLRRVSLPPFLANEEKHFARFAVKRMQDLAANLAATVVRLEMGLIDRQCLVAQISDECQKLVTMLALSFYASKSIDPLVKKAASIRCQELKDELTGSKPSKKYFRAVTSLGARILESGCTLIDEVPENPILQNYNE